MKDKPKVTNPAPTSERTTQAAAVQEAPVNLVSIINRIEDAIERETAAIRKDINFDIRESNSRKSRYLYEFSRATKGLGVDDLRPEHREGILRLRRKLEINERTVLAHLNAVAEVAAMIQKAIETSDGDGTYSAGAFAREAVG